MEEPGSSWYVVGIVGWKAYLMASRGFDDLFTNELNAACQMFIYGSVREDIASDKVSPGTEFRVHPQKTGKPTAPRTASSSTLLLAVLYL